MALLVAPNYTLNLVGLPMIAILISLRVRSATLASPVTSPRSALLMRRTGGKKRRKGLDLDFWLPWPDSLWLGQVNAAVAENTENEVNL